MEVTHPRLRLMTCETGYTGNGRSDDFHHAHGPRKDSIDITKKRNGVYDTPPIAVCDLAPVLNGLYRLMTM